MKTVGNILTEALRTAWRAKMKKTQERLTSPLGLSWQSAEHKSRLTGTYDETSGSGYTRNPAQWGYAQVATPTGLLNVPKHVLTERGEPDLAGGGTYQTGLGAKLRGDRERRVIVVG